MWELEIETGNRIETVESTLRPRNEAGFSFLNLDTRKPWKIGINFLARGCQQETRIDAIHTSCCRRHHRHLFHPVCHHQAPPSQSQWHGGPFVCNCSTLLVRRAAADTLRAHFDVTQIPGVSRRRIHQIQSPSDASRSSKVLVQGSMSVCSTVSSSSSLRCSRLMICVVEHRISIQPQ